MGEKSIMVVPAANGEGGLILTGTPEGNTVVRGATGEVMSQTVTVDPNVNKGEEK